MIQILCLCFLVLLWSYIAVAGFFEITPEAYLDAFLKKYFQARDVYRFQMHLFRRYFIFPRLMDPKHREKYKVALFIHRLYRSDPDQHLHDHPWDWISIPLGFYEEEDASGTHTCWPLVPRFRKAEYAHRLYLLNPVWTIFIHFRRRREWGFHTHTGWVHHTKYGEPEPPRVSLQ